MKLRNKYALITGAAKGIGAAIAEKFHQEGAHVYITDIDEEDAQVLANRLGAGAEFIYLDVSDEQNWMKVFSQIKQLDVLVNNAGITGFGDCEGPFDPENCDLESWNFIHRINATGTMLGCKYGIRKMKESKGSIINLSSRSGNVGVGPACAYASSKASIRNHTKSVALYCAHQKYNIRCNSLHPAAILTPMWETMLGEGEAREKAKEAVEHGIPMGRFGTAEEVANAAVFLASDDSSYMTGSEVHLDGGILAGSESSPDKK